MDSKSNPINIIAKAAETPDYPPTAVRALMKRFDMNERAFGLLMNVTPMTVRLWTSGVVVPCGLSRRLMQIYSACPEVVDKMIALAEHPDDTCPDPIQIR